MAYTERFAEGAAAHLQDDEEVELALRGSVAPMTWVMGAVTFVALFGAFTLSTGVTSLSLRLTIVVLMVGVIAAMYLVYAATLFKGPIGPYVVVGLTQDRVLILERDLLGRLRGDPIAGDRDTVEATLTKRTLLLPNRITLTGLTDQPLELDIPRIEPSAQFMAALEG